MTKRVWTAAAVVALFTAGAALAVVQDSLGQPRRGGPPVFAGPMGPGSPLRDLGLAGLDLTEAQRDQVRTIMESHREALQQAAAKLREAHRAFAEATFAAAVDEAAIRARSTEVAAAMADEAILRATIRGEVSAILTEEQRQQLESRRAARPRRI